MRSDLEKVAGVSNITTDVATQICTFQLADPSFDVKGKLTELAGTNEHIAGWSLVE